METVLIIVGYLVIGFFVSTQLSLLAYLKKKKEIDGEHRRGIVVLWPLVLIFYFFIGEDLVI